VEASVKSRAETRLQKDVHLSGWRFCGTAALLIAALVLAAGIGADEIEPEPYVEPEAPAEKVAPATPTEPEEATYLGDAACLTCHEALHEGFTGEYSKTIHAKVLAPQNALNEKMARGCEACHGPGSLHVQAGGGKGVGGLVDFEGDSPEAVLAQDATCMQCHQGGDRRFWTGSVHSTRDVGCISCHSVMQSVSESNQLTHETEVETCAQCHQIQNARQYRNAHMPLRPGAFQSSSAADGKMSCSSCHNPHGTVGEKLIAHISTRDNCLSCHADKRGPFLWEHAPVTEDCLNCHDPHGTTRESMLKLGLPRLCSSCHGTGHAGNSRTGTDRFVVGTSCLQCHGQIHGSNHPSGQRLLR
jgi:DmsE family decaheme c-type cytochrome